VLSNGQKWEERLTRRVEMNRCGCVRPREWVLGAAALHGKQRLLGGVWRLSCLTGNQHARSAALDEKQQSAEIPASGKGPPPFLTVGIRRAEMGRNGDSADTLNRLADAADVPIAGVERKTNTSPDSSAG
jgi:hypothetical protein